MTTFMSIFFAINFSKLLAASIISFKLLILIFVKTSAPGMLGVKTNFLTSLFFKVFMALLSISLNPPSQLQI